MCQKKKEEKMNLTFEEWIERLKKDNPSLEWGLMSEGTMATLRETYDSMRKMKDKNVHNKR